MSSQCRKETHWTTVHTVCLDDSDFDDISPKSVQRPNGIQMRNLQAGDLPHDTGPGQHGAEGKADVKGGPADAEGERVTSRGRTEGEQSSGESEEDEIAEDDDLGPCRDLFSAHFDKLASDPKVKIPTFPFVDYVLYKYLQKCLLIS